MTPAGELLSLSREEYDAMTDRANFSTLKHLDKSPAHLLHALEERGEDKDAYKVGRCTHLAVFEPAIYEADVVTWSGGTRRGKEWDVFRARHAGFEILTENETETVQGLARAVRTHPDVARYLEAGEAEVTALWTDSATGVACKGRLDWIAGSGALLDLKNTKDASPDGFGRAAYAYRYHAQAALYSDAVHAATDERLPYVLIAVESVAPYVVQPYVVTREQIDAGRRIYRTWLARLLECRESNRWPGYVDGRAELALPRWADRAGEGADEDQIDAEASEA